MAKFDKYEIDDPLFDEEHGVLKNKLEITDRDKLDSVERQHLVNAYRKAALGYSENHVFTEHDVCDLHKLFLGKIYEWAGSYRTVDLSSDDIRFCHAAYIHDNMKAFSGELSKLSPFAANLSKHDIIDRLAIIHGEMIVIHPFRDGNGRVTRLLCDLLLMQARYRPFKMTSFYRDDFVKRYYRAIRKIWYAKDYSELATLFEPLIVR